MNVCDVCMYIFYHIIHYFMENENSRSFIKFLALHIILIAVLKSRKLAVWLRILGVALKEFGNLWPELLGNM